MSRRASIGTLAAADFAAALWAKFATGWLGDCHLPAGVGAIPQRCLGVQIGRESVKGQMATIGSVNLTNLIGKKND